MAKFFGLINKNSKDNRNILKQMASSFEGAAFYKKVFYLDGNLSLGGLFLENEKNSLFQSKDKKFVVLFSGYLLNEEQKEKPAEFVFKLFSKFGKNFVKKLNGVFNIIIYQKDKNIFYIFNDRYGVLPLYYYLDNGKFIFASEVKAVLKEKNVKRKIDWDAWSDYFSFRYILGNKTFFKQIKSLPEASCLICQNGKIMIEKYWDYSMVQIDYKHDENYFLDKGKQLVKEAILKSSKGIDRGICFLSGGYDSRCLAAGLKKYTNVNFDTYTTQHPTGEKDYVLAKKVASNLGVKNYFVKHPKNIYQKYFLKKIRLLDGMVQEHLWALPLANHFKKTSFVFDGLAGDLFLKGLFLDNYNLSAISNNQKLSSIIADQCGYDLFFIRKFFKKEIKKQLNFSKKNLVKELKSVPKGENRISIFFAKNRTRNALCLSSQNIFFRLNKRFPFLENNLVNFALSIPPSIKIGDHLYLNILQESFPEIKNIPTTNDNSFLKKLDKLIWDILTRLRLQRLIKSFLKNYLFARQLSNSDINFLVSLLNKLNIPSYINKKTVSDYLHKKRFDFSLFCLIDHLVWYNSFYIKN